MVQRRQFGQFAASALAAACVPLGAQQSETIQLLVGFPSGGVSDRVARVVSRYLARALDEAVLVDNRPGAGGVVAARMLKMARPNGQTLMLSPTHTMAVVPLLFKDAGYDSEKDFVRLGGLASVVDCLAISANVPATTLEGWAQWVRADPKRAHVGVSAMGSAQEVAVRMLSQRYGLDLVPVPFAGSAPIMLSLQGHHIGAGLASVPDFHSVHHAGRIRVLALFGEQRHTLLPEVATFAQLGMPGLETVQSYGLYAPAHLPLAEKARLTEGVAEMVKMRGASSSLLLMGLTVEYISPEALAEREQAYLAHWQRQVRQVGMQSI